MFRLSTEDIRDEVYNPQTYMKGLQYYRNGRVLNFDFNPDVFSLTATVEGTEHYDVDVEFDEEGDILEMFCDCPAYYEYDGACKHIVAALFKLKEQLEEGDIAFSHHFQSSKNVSAVNRLFASYVSSFNKRARNKTEIQLVPRLKIQALYGRCYVSLELQIGKDKLYIVKNIKTLLDSIASGEKFVFGKQFTLDPSSHCFSNSGKEIINFLDKILRSETGGLKPQPFFHRTDSAFDGKSFHFHLPSFESFFRILCEAPFLVEVDGKKIEDVTVKEAELPLEYTITRNDEGLSILSENTEELLRLFENGNYFFKGRHIYKVPDDQIENIAPLYTALKSVNGNLSIPHQGFSTFVSVILPAIRKAAEVKVDKSLDDCFIHEEFMAKIYFDKEGKGISGKLEFLYGEHRINPIEDTFSSELKINDKLLVRDLEKENKLFALLAKAGFKKSSGQVYLMGEDAIFDFVSSILPELAGLCEVYYSDAFKNLQLRTPKISSSVKLSEHSNMLEISFDFDDIDRAELGEVFQSLKLKKKYHRLKNGSFIHLDSDEMGQVATLMEQLNLSGKDLSKKVIELPKYRALYLDNYLRDSNAHYMERSASFKQMVQNIKEPEDMEFEVPEPLSNVLRDYQKVGYKWLKTLSTYGMGGILADDMGLGKTLQVLAFLLSEKASSRLPALVIAPKSLLYNWQDEVQKFTPQMKALVVIGTPQERKEQIKEVDNVDVVITSYSLIRSDVDLYKGKEFSYCFLDEAQHIKNPNTISAKSVKIIKAQGYFALTGTPIENSITELWSIFDFVMPGYLLSHTKFSKRFEKPILRDNDQEALNELSRHIRPFILRRLKKNVLKELPEKIENKMTAEMTQEQKKLYLAYLSQAKKELASELHEKGFQKSQLKILSLLTRLRQICCHPSLFVEGYQGDSGKMQLLMEVLEDAFDSNHRVLLFSQFTGVLALIKQQLDALKIKYFYLDGSTPAEERMRLVREFNTGTVPLFLISLKAGGTGLNLTGADTVIHFDPWWNPAVEDQATDRAYRIGQENVVHVMKLITRGSIEERIFELQQRKKELIDSVIKPGETFLTKMSEEEVKSLFELEV